MPKTVTISLNLGDGFAGLNLAAQIIKSSGLNITSYIYDGFYEVGEGFYVWEYANFPENFRGGVKFFDREDTSIVVSFIDVTAENSDICSCNEECFADIGDTFDITYSDQPNLSFYALLFSAEDLSKAWNVSINNFQTYTLENHSTFAISLVQDSERLGWYEYVIENIENIPPVIGDKYYFIEVWQLTGSVENRLVDCNTGTLRVCWGKQSNDWLEIAKRVWEYGTRTLTDLPEIPPGITPQEIWEYAVRTLTSGGGGDCDYSELERHILAAIVASTGKTLEELEKTNAELGNSINKTFELLETCCNGRVRGTPIVQTPRIGPRGSKGSGPDMKFK